MAIKLSDHFTYRRLFRFVLPSIVMMIFTSIYGVVDGLFVSNFVGKSAFAAVNFIIPFTMMLGGFGFMVGAGGSAIVSMTMGAGDHERAKRYFSMLVYVTAGVGVVMGAAGIIWLRPIAIFMGADDAMLDTCVTYGRIVLVAQPAFMLQNVFQSFFVTAEKPQLGLAVTVAAGVTNMALDFVLVGVLQLGVVGAATATALSEAVGGLTPLFYFSRKNSSLLHLVPAKPEARPLLKTFANGSSEFMTNFSISLVNMLYNYQLMRLTGEDGVAAYGVIMYVNFIFVSIFLGYSIGSAPIISFNYGSGNSAELKNVFRKSLKAVGTVALVLTVLSQCAAPLLAKIFVGYDAALFTMTSRGFRLFALSYLICWVNIYGSSFFTALNNGAVSALISFLRTLLFQVAAVLILPLLLGLDGVWLAIVCAELLASSVTISCLVKFKARYNYG